MAPRSLPARFVWHCLWGVLIGGATLHAQAQPQLLDDRSVTLTNSARVAERRAALIRHVWGSQGFPTQRLPEVVQTNLPPPVRGLTACRRVDALEVRLTPKLQGLLYHFVPERPNGCLVVVHHGHACTLDDDPSPAEVGYGLQRTVHALLREGFGVLGAFMPHMRPGDCSGGHDALFQEATEGNPMRFFVEPVAVGLNYLERRAQADDFPSYRKFFMTGLSGGGWTTTVYAALDPRIQASFPVAGTLPLYLRTGGSVGDREQFDAAFYGLAGYPDLYVLGAAGPGRRQVQILVRRDDCCFGEAQHDAGRAGLTYATALREYEARVQSALTRVGAGAFRIEIDEVAPSHMISHHAIERILLPGLRELVR